MKVISIVKQLNEKLGGNWEYDRSCGYWRDKSRDRYVCWVVSFYNDETDYNKDLYLYYNDGTPSERVYL